MLNKVWILAQSVECIDKDFHIVRVSEVCNIFSNPFLNFVSQHARYRIRLITYDALVIYDSDNIHGVFDQRFKILFATLDSFLSLLALCDISQADDNTFYNRIIEKVASHSFNSTPGAVFMLSAYLGLQGATPIRQESSEELGYPLNIVG